MRQVVNVKPEEGEVSRKREAVMRIAEETAIGIRRSTRNNNVRQSVDFVNGIIFAGLLLEKNAPADQSLMQSFDQLFREQSTPLLDHFRSGGSPDVVSEMRTHDLGVVDQSPTEMLVMVGLSAQGVISEIGVEYGLTKWDQMLVAAFIVVAAVFANTNEEDLVRALKKVSLAVSEKTKVWDDIIPPDDDWMNEPD
jgi:hypothetical protein